MARPPTSAAHGGRVTLLAGRYELLRTQETDANTASILAFDQRLKRWRSIRVARPGDDAAAERLVALAQRAAQLEHPNLERVLDVGRDGPVAFVVRDRFVGSVAQHVAKRGAVAPGWAVRVVARCAEGLAWAHPRGIIHGHPRPEVVLFAEDGEAILTRFGQRALLRDDEETRSGAPWAHLAPELRQYWEPNITTDVFALGALLYTMLAGHHSADLFYAEAYEGVLAPVPRPLRPIVIQACAFEPSERFASAADLQDALLSRLKSLDAAHDPAPWLEVTQDFPERGDLPESDAIVDEIARALGFPPPSARANLVDDRATDSTLDPQTPHSPMPYSMPMGRLTSPPLGSSAYPSPGQGSSVVTPLPPPPLGLFAADLPDYVDASSVPLTPDHRVQRIGPPPPPAGHDSAEIPVGVMVRWVLVAILFTLTFVGVAGSVAWYFASRGTTADLRFVDSVLAEEGAFGTWALEDARLKALWADFHAAPPEMRASAASDFVRVALERAHGAPEMVPAEVNLSLDRLEDARRDWKVSR